MSFKEELEAAAAKAFGEIWSKRQGTVVPEAEDLTLGNQAVLLEGTVLYADMAQSTAMVDGFKPFFSAEVYKAFLYTAARIIGYEGGSVVAYDGDRVMAIFIGDSKNSSAARCALKINWAVTNIVTPAMKKQYATTTHTIGHTVGIDTGDLWVARTGVRGSNDLVWVGRAANYAAKLTELRSTYKSWITERVYKNLNENSKYSSGVDMWEPRTWTEMGSQRVYCSSYWWAIP